MSRAWTKSPIRRARDLIPCICSMLFGACTYGPRESVASIANHVNRQGTDSIGIAVYAREVLKPVGIASFPDGGSPRIERETAIFYLCVLSRDGGARRRENVACWSETSALGRKGAFDILDQYVSTFKSNRKTYEAVRQVLRVEIGSVVSPIG